MKHLIDKDALLAEIENIKSIEFNERNSSDAYACMALDMVKEAIDNLEVKDFDLDKETTHYLLYEHLSPLNEIMHKADLKSEMQYHKDIENAFKDGFKLGLKVQKGEEV